MRLTGHPAAAQVGISLRPHRLPPALPAWREGHHVPVGQHLHGPRRTKRRGNTRHRSLRGDAPARSAPPPTESPTTERIGPPQAHPLPLTVVARDAKWLTVDQVRCTGEQWRSRTLAAIDLLLAVGVSRELVSRGSAGPNDLASSADRGRPPGRGGGGASRRPRPSRNQRSRAWRSAPA
jgi:hypothetical protein